MHELFQLHNAPAHTSIKTEKNWENGFTLLESWPAQSPYLNIIENLWSVLKRNICKRHEETLEELRNYAQEEFEKKSGSSS